MLSSALENPDQEGGYKPRNMPDQRLPHLPTAPEIGYLWGTFKIRTARALS
jgi:hypothetical protein